MSLARWGVVPGLLLAVVAGSCSKESAGPSGASPLPNLLVIRVEGMQKGEGGKT